MKTPFLHAAVLLGLLIFLRGDTLLCQPERGRPDDEAMQGSFGIERVRFDCINLPSADTLKSRLLVRLEIPNSFFIALKENAPGAGYGAAGDGSIEILDTNRNSVVRKIFHVELHSPFPPGDSGVSEQAILKTLSFDLMPGQYELLIDVNDAQSTRKFHHTLQKSLKDFRRTPAASDIVLVSPDTTDTRVLRQLPVVDDALFGKDFRMYFELHTQNDTLRNFTYKFYRYEMHPTEKNLVAQDSIPLLVPQSRRIGEVAEDDTASVPAFVPASGGYRSVELPIRSSQLEYGRYMLEVKFLDGAKKAATGKLMGIRWPSMPRSLARPDYAINLLEYIMTPAEFTSLKSLDREDQVKAFEKFWKSKDPTPETAYNEALDEYYRRADYARSAYASVKYSDGAMTDRGKISILFGIPPSANREFPSGTAPVETWTYPSLHKRFIFIDQDRNGSYRLRSVEQL